MRKEILRRKKRVLRRKPTGSRKLEIVSLLLMLSLEVVNVRKTMGLISPALSVLNFVTSQSLVLKVFLRSMTHVKLVILRTLVQQSQLTSPFLNQQLMSPTR